MRLSRAFRGPHKAPKPNPCPRLRARRRASVHSSVVRGVSRVHRYSNSSARGELPMHGEPARSTRLNKVIEDAIDNFLVEAAHVAIGSEIEFQRLRFDTTLVGNIIDAN